jgi:tetratricopeptide (TPR) repeat protein
MENSRKSMWVALVVILAVGALLRGLYLVESMDKPDFAQPMADAGFHDYWARALVTGDWSPPANDPNPYIDSVPYVRPPGYPYFLAGLYAVTGQSYVGARVLQILLGLVNCWLAFLLGRAVFRPAVGLILAAMTALYWGLIYIEIELHDPVLLITLSLAFMLVMNAWRTRPALWRLVAAGLLLGLMILVRPNVAVFAPAAAGWLWWHGGRRVAPAVILAAATIVGVLPATVRNLVVAGDLVAVSANGAINLYIGNNESADGVTTRIPMLQEITGQTGWSCYSFDQIVQGVSEGEGRPMKYSEVDRYFLGLGLREITGAPGRFLGLTARRAALFWGPATISNNKAVGAEKANSAVLRWIPGFPFALGLALLGGALLWHERRTVRPATAGGAAAVDWNGPLLALVLLYIAAVFASYLPFIVAERFRLPLLPFIMLPGAYAVWRLATAAGARDWGAAGKLTAGAVVLVFVAGLSPVEVQNDRAWWHTDQAASLALAGDMAGAEREYRAALRENSGFVDAHVGLANMLAMSGRYREALTHYQTVVKHRPGHLEARTGLAGTLTLTGQPDQAAQHVRRTLAMSPDCAPAHFELGRALAALGQYDEAERELRDALRLEPDQALAQVTLGMVMAAKGDHPAAIGELRQALLMEPRNVEALVQLGGSLSAVDSLTAGHDAFTRALEYSPDRAATIGRVGLVLFRDGNYRQAEQWYREGVKAAPGLATMHSQLAKALANQGRLAEAEAEMRRAQELDRGNRSYAQDLQRIREMMKSGGN